MERMPERIDSKFRFVLLAATRAEQLMRGARPKEDDAGRKPTTLAMDEVLDEKLGWEYGPPPEPEPLEGELEAVEDEIH